jgi:molybdopterin synthase sulfur carrier subunit
MRVAVLIPGPLRPYCKGSSKVILEPAPATLADALERLWEECPGMKDRVMTEQFQIREHINVFVGMEHIRYTGGLQTPLGEGSEIAIIPAISGGK